MSEYKSPMTTGHRKHIYLDPQDPRATTEKNLEDFRSKSGAKVVVRDQTLKYDNMVLGDFIGGWYLRTLETGVDYGAAIASNENSVFISTSSESFLITTPKGIQTGEYLNYVDDIWQFYETPDKAILAFVESPSEFLECYYFLERFAINSARFFPSVPYTAITAAGSNGGDMYVSMNAGTETTILKYLSNETEQWEKTVDIICGDLICADNDNRAYCASKSLDTLKISAFDIEGNIRWSKDISGIINDEGEAVKILASDAVYIVGHCGHPLPDLDIFVIKLDLDGNLIWSNIYEHEDNAILEDASLNEIGVLLCGYVSTSETSSDGFVFEISKGTGEVSWSRKMISKYIAGDKNDVLYGCAADTEKNYVSGIILKSGNTPRVFASGVGGAFPLGEYNLEGYYFEWQNTFFSRDPIEITINDLSPNISPSSKIAINSPSGIYGE